MASPSASSQTIPSPRDRLYALWSARIAHELTPRFEPEGGAEEALRLIVTCCIHPRAELYALYTPREYMASRVLSCALTYLSVGIAPVFDPRW